MRHKAFQILQKTETIIGRTQYLELLSVLGLVLGLVLVLLGRGGDIGTL